MTAHGVVSCVSDAPSHPVASAAATSRPTERGVNVTAISEFNLQNTQYTTPIAPAWCEGYRNTVWYDSSCTPIRSSVCHLR